MRYPRPANAVTRAIARGALLLAALSFCAASQAQLRIGISGPLEGKNAGSMLEIVKGAEIYFDQVNRAGGINGQKVQLLARNDDFQVDKTVAVVRKLIEEDQVLGLMLVRGTPHNEAILPLIAKHRVPLIAPSTGAMVFHQPVNPYVFNVRTAYQTEARRLVELLKTTQMRRIAVLYVADGFGKDVLAGLNQGFLDAQMQPIAVVPFDRDAATKDNTDFVVGAVPALIKGDPEVIIVVGAGLAVKNATLAIRAAGSHANIATMSNNASGAFVALMGKHARGTIVTQVFPDPKNYTDGLVAEAQVASRASKVTLTTGMMEGFAAAKVTAAALKAAGRNPTRAGLLRSLETLNRVEIGSSLVGYSERDHTGLTATDLTMITRDGSFLR
jgi:ABC-type branched-subunit amino acid transport system substrate-binding protein